MGRVRLTLEDKIQILEDSRRTGFKRKTVLEKYGISESTLSVLLSKKSEKEAFFVKNRQKISKIAQKKLYYF